MAEPICTVADCGRPVLVASRGWCSLHYQRWQRHGNPAHLEPRVRRVGVALCAIDGCAKVVVARGWCSAHWSRWQRHGSPTARVRGEVVDGRRICSMCGEDKPVDDFLRSNDPCRLCQAAARRAFRAANPGWWRTAAHRAAVAAYRARKYAATVEVFDPLEVYERDGWVCGLCGEPIDPACAWPDPGSPSLDHVIPLIRGGDHSRANTQASHLRCNTAKRDRML